MEIKRRFVATCRWFGPQLKWRVNPVVANGEVNLKVLMVTELQWLAGCVNRLKDNGTII